MDKEFISMRIAKPDVAHSIIAGTNQIVIDDIYTLNEKLKNGKIIFVALGGDKGSSEVDWETGYYALVHVIKDPYEKYNGKYFKFDINVDWRIPKPMPRENFNNYPGSNAAPFIGLETKRDPTQAVATLDYKKAVTIIRAVIDKYPDEETKIEQVMGTDFMNDVRSPICINVPIETNYRETPEAAMRRRCLKYNEELSCESDNDKKKSISGINYPLNRIVFGAPGTGKSHKLKEDCEDILSGTGGSFERVTFHPDYTYSQFVGTYKPVSEGDTIKYRYVPGPFMRILVDAYKSVRTENLQPYVLVIEEINRAKVAAVFGDVFQLLDRDDDGVSEYEIQTSEDIRKYLASELGGEPEKYSKIKLPNNMFIWATMNSADQGVYPMDTAFKRRWNFEYIGIDENEDKVRGKFFVAGEIIEWNSLRKAINAKLSGECRVNEDKLMGPFFISRQDMKTVSDTDDTIKDNSSFIKIFKSKVLMYLYEDAAKQCKQKLFSGCEDTTKYSAVCSKFDEIGIKIFGENFEIAE